MTTCHGNLNIQGVRDELLSAQRGVLEFGKQVSEALSTHHYCSMPYDPTLLKYMYVFCTYLLSICNRAAYLQAQNLTIPIIYTPSHSIKDVPPLSINNKKFTPTRIISYKPSP
jgi:hypothetical protein